MERAVVTMEDTVLPTGTLVPGATVAAKGHSMVQVRGKILRVVPPSVVWKTAPRMTRDGNIYSEIAKSLGARRIEGKNIKRRRYGPNDNRDTAHLNLSTC